MMAHFENGLISGIFRVFSHRTTVNDLSNGFLLFFLEF